MTVWNGRNYDDLDAVERAKVDEARVWVGERMLEWQAGELRAQPHRSGEIVDFLVEEGILADHMAALRWMATVLANQPEVAR